MSELENAPFHVSAPVVEITNGWDGMSGFRVGTVHKVYKTGNFLIDWHDGPNVSDQQYRPSFDANPSARRTGENRWGRSQAVIWPLTAEREAAIETWKRCKSVRARLDKVQSKVAALKLKVDAPEHDVQDTLKLVSQLEALLPT